MLALIDLENETWTAEVGPTINDPVAENYKIVQQGDAISLVMCSSLPYSGWLAKQVAKWPCMASKIIFRYTMMIDDATLTCAQVAETDAKFTDSDGYTYDGSAQWNIAKGWMFQIGNPWTDTGVTIEPFKPYVPQQVTIEYDIDYTGKAISIVAVTTHGERHILDSKPIPAVKEGWAPSEIVTQLQQCNTGSPGGYTLRFTKIGYAFCP
jgi:hypothetical protein